MYSVKDTIKDILDNASSSDKRDIVAALLHNMWSSASDVKVVITLRKVDNTPMIIKETLITEEITGKKILI